MPIDLIDTIKPKNNGMFPMVEAEDVVVGKGTADEKRLPEALAEAGKVAAVDTAMPEAPTDDHVPSTQLLKELLAGYLKLASTTEQSVNGNVRINGRLYVSELFSGGGAQFFQVVSSAGFNLLNIDKLIALGNKTFMENRTDGVYLTAKSITEDGTALVNKYALKDHTHDGVYAPKATTYTKEEVDTKISNALGDISAALAAI